jgi:hypothetical protein
MDQWKAKTNVDIHSKRSNSHWTYPVDSSFLLINETDSFVRHTLTKNVINLDNESVNSIFLPPFSSKVLIGELSITSTTYFTSDPTVIASVNASTENKVEISFYPNPVNDILYINLEYNSNLPDVELMDLLGRELNRFKFHSDQLTLNMQQYKAGIYFIRIGSVVKKILVQH